MLLRVAAINVPTGVGPAAWRKCFRRADRRSDIFGVNEVFTRRHKRIYLRMAKRRGLGQYGTRITPNPVYWDASKYRKVSARRIKLHGPDVGWRARRYPGFNEGREATEVILQSLEDAGAPQVVALNFHLAPRGWKVRASWRRKMWRRSKRILNARIAHHVARGRAVVPLGDGNNPRLMLRAVTWLARKGVDVIGLALPGNLRARRRTSRPFVAPTDHGGGISASVEITRRSTS